MYTSHELHLGDEAYPKELQLLEKPPDPLYVYGDLDVLAERNLSVVGARQATPYGIAASRMAGRVAAECGLCVVSGGARGCDSAAARAALAAGGKTIVICGTGADRVYPDSSRDVFEKALAQGGAIVSMEYWGQPPKRWAFPKRNQLIAALGEVLFVCEAGIRSGTTSTAEVATNLGRRVYAVPGSIFSPQSVGTNRLIADGAAMVCSEQDLEAMISLDFGCLRAWTGQIPAEEGRVLSALIASATRPDELALTLGMDPLTLLRTLSEYETKNIVERLPDGRYAPTADYLNTRARIGQIQITSDCFSTSIL